MEMTRVLKPAAMPEASAAVLSCAYQTTANLPKPSVFNESTADLFGIFGRTHEDQPLWLRSVPHTNTYAEKHGESPRHGGRADKCDVVHINNITAGGNV